MYAIRSYYGIRGDAPGEPARLRHQLGVGHHLRHQPAGERLGRELLLQAHRGVRQGGRRERDVITSYSIHYTKLYEAADGALRGILAFTTDEIVSSDVIGQPVSATVDGASTQVLDGDMLKVIAWYDNEWGYSCRCADLLALVASRLPAGTAGTAV